MKRTGPPIFRTAPILIKMSLFIPVGLAVCFSVGPILSSTLIYIEIRNVRASPYVSEYDYRWEKIAGIVVGIISVGLGIAGIVAVATVPYSRKEIYYWLDGVIMCNPKFSSATMSGNLLDSVSRPLLTDLQLARLLQSFISPRWALWAVHLVAFATILDIVSAVK